MLLDTEKDEKMTKLLLFFSTKGSRGAGIGLMLTKKIVEAHKDSISVQSERGKGSKFIISLPGLPNG